MTDGGLIGSVTNVNALGLRSATTAVKEEIRRLLYTGELVPGHRVPVDELAARFNVSRTPVREALAQLSAEGLVTIEPRVGVFVRIISDKEILEVYRIKRALEPLMASWAAERGSPEQRREFAAAIKHLEDAIQAGDIPRYVSLLEERREALLEMADSSALRDSLGILDGRVRLLRFRNLSQPGVLDKSLAGHKEVAKAILDGDPEAAYDAMLRHMLDAEAGIRQLLNNRPKAEAEPVGAGKASRRSGRR